MKITSSIFSEEPLLQNFLFFVFLDRHVFFFILHQVEVGKGEDEGGGDGGRALSMQESGWCATLVVVMNLL